MEYQTAWKRNFIAFLYYYYLAKGSLSSEAVKDKIVVIDAPVSSMDSGALFIVSALVREMIEVCYNNTDYRSHKVDGDYIKQIFILTHNVYFHKEITHHQAKPESTYWTKKTIIQFRILMPLCGMNTKNWKWQIQWRM